MYNNIMKRSLLIITFLLFSIVPVFAETMAVQALTDISTTEPEKDVRVRVMRDCTLADIPMKIGYVLEGKMIVTDAKRLKRDASFTFYPVNYIDLEGNVIHISQLYYGKFSPKFEIDAKSLAESAVVSVANHFIKGISSGFYAVQGAVKNEKGNRLTSAAYGLYQHSFLSYVEKGQPLTIVKETLFGLKFDECKNEPLSEEK